MNLPSSDQRDTGNATINNCNGSESCSISVSMFNSWLHIPLKEWCKMCFRTSEIKSQTNSKKNLTPNMNLEEEGARCRKSTHKRSLTTHQNQPLLLIHSFLWRTLLDFSLSESRTTMTSQLIMIPHLTSSFLLSVCVFVYVSVYVCVCVDFCS